MSAEFISVRELAKELGITHVSVRRYIKKKGIEPEKRRYKGSRAVQDVISLKDADFVRKMREEEGFDGTIFGQAADTTGSFYVIQLIPELDGSRLKLGYADDINIRLTQHRTAAPTAQLLKTWPCKRSWEAVAIACLTKSDCHLILNEVYECSDIQALLHRGDSFFSLMPDPAVTPKLSDKSPRNSSGS